MLGDPISRVTKAVGEAGKIERIPQRSRAGGAGCHRREIEDGERDHAQRTANQNRRTRQSFFQPVRRPLRNCSAIAEAIG